MPRKKVERRIEEYGKMISFYEDEELGESFFDILDKIAKIDGRKDNRLDEKDADSLIKLYGKTVDLINEELEDEKTNDNTKAMLNKYLVIIGKDVTELNRYKLSLSDPGHKKKDLTEIIESSRSKKIKMENVDELEVEQAAQNSRFRVNVSRGTETVKTYFTASESGVSDDEKKKRLLDDMKKKYGKNAAFLEDASFQNAMRNLLDCTDNDFNATYSDMLESPGRMISQFGLRDSVNILKDHIGAGSLSALKTPLKFNIFNEYYTQYKKIESKSIIDKRLGVEENARNDRKNSAMSMVAELMGCEDIIAHSENLTLRVPGGKGKTRLIKGTAMDPVYGSDINKMSNSDNFMKISMCSVEDNTGLIKQVADLQLLDYLCGHADRHVGNIIYNVNEQGKLVGIKAIDNDSSFAEKFNPMDKFGVPINSMKVIPRSTAERILKMDEKAFELSLYGYDLKEKEIDGAKERLKALKKEIKSSLEHYKDCVDGYLEDGKPRVVDDEKLAEYSFNKQLAIEKDELNDENTKIVSKFNLFGAIAKRANSEYAAKKAKECLLNKLDSDYKKLFSEDFLRLGKSVKDTYELDRKLFGGSGNYTDMKESMKAVKDAMAGFKGAFFEDTIDDEYDPEGNKKDLALTNKAENLKNKIKKAREMTEKYINGKADDRESNTEGTRSYKRLHNAKKNLKILKAMENRFTEIDNALAERLDTNRVEEENRQACMAADAAMLTAKEKKIDEINLKEQDRKIDVHIKELEEKEAGLKGNKEKIVEHAYAKLDVMIAKGLTAMARAKDKKDPEAEKAFETAVAACILKDRFTAKEKSSNNKEAGKKLEKYEKLEFDNSGNMEKAVEALKKTEGFKKIFPKVTRNIARKDCMSLKKAAAYVKTLGDAFLDEAVPKAQKTKKTAPKLGS